MEDTLGFYAQIALLIVAIYFTLLTVSGLINLYLRFHEHLPIDKEDTQALSRNTLNVFLIMVAAILFHYLPFFMALGFLLFGVLIFQLLKINSLLKKYGTSIMNSSKK